MIGTSHEREAQRRKVNLVNKLIEDSFGNYFSGDWFHQDQRPSWFRISEEFERRDELNMVRKKGYRSFKHEDKPYAAIFSEKDGCSMTVFPEHYLSAIKYSILYEKIFGKKVEIRAPEGQDLY